MRRTTSGPVMAILVLACTQSTIEPEVIDTLVATSVDGEALPATVANWPDFHLEILADTIRFSGEGYTQRRVQRVTGITGMPEILETGTDGSVRVGSGSITLEPFCDALFCTEVVLRGKGDRYRAMWAPVEGVEVVVEYRPLADLPDAGN